MLLSGESVLPVLYVAHEIHEPVITPGFRVPVQTPLCYPGQHVERIIPNIPLGSVMERVRAIDTVGTKPVNFLTSRFDQRLGLPSLSIQPDGRKLRKIGTYSSTQTRGVERPVTTWALSQ